jgi:undecaprenyl-diphosphatase
MGLMEAILLGALQGITEFLPVSSSGHLVAAQQLLGVREPGIGLEVSVHFGTLLAILVAFARPLWATARDGFVGVCLWMRGRGRMVDEAAPRFPAALAVLVGTLPVALAGVLFQSRIERLFESMVGAGVFLCLTGVLLAASRFAPRADRSEVGPARGLLIGVAQAFALLPGISRSGITIVTGRFAGLSRDSSARFSFVLAVPALLGASLWKLQQVMGAPSSQAAPAASPLPLLVATVTAAVVGYVSLMVLLRAVRSGLLHWFAGYCLPAGLAMIVLGVLGHG